MKVWDMNDLLHQRERAASNQGRNATELYFDTAGEIEARDASNRRTKSEGQRKTSPPRLGNEDTVFAEGTGISADYVGKTDDGIEVYETSEKTRNLTWTERKKAFLHLMRQQYRGRTAKFIRNGHAYYAKFEYRDVSKNIYGDDKSDPKGRDAKINVGADGNIFELVENSKYGASRYTNYNHFIYGMCAAIMAIILIGSVSLIYNAFSISVSERTKQFGLLSSVGATKKQLRRSVYFEALTLSGIGVPLGILCGYFGIAVTLHFTGGLVDDLMAGAVEGNIALVAIPSLPAFLCAGVVAVWTVLISAWLPARRATSLSPITAIRQNQDIQIPKRGLKGKLTPSRISQNLARKYNQVNARKYRSTVVSLTISIVLFLTSASLSADLRNTVKSNANTYNFDFDITISDLAQGEEIRNLDCAGQSAYAQGWYEMTVIPEDAFTPEYVSQWETAMETWYREESINLKQAYLVYLEDEIFTSILEENGIDPGPYFRKEAPTALVMTSRFQMLTETEKGYEMISYSADMLKENSPPLSLYTNACPNEVFEFVEPRIGGHRWDISMMDGMPVYEYQCTIAEVTEELVASDPWIWPDGSIRFAMKNLDDGDFGFFLIDPDTGMPNEVPTGSVPNTVPVQEVHLGETLRELPFGCPGYSGAQDIVLLMPLSLYPGEEVPDLLVKATDYRKMKEYLDTNGISYLDHMESEVQYRNMVTMINVFSYGFIILISLVCVCNIFNTVSTNIALRRRDFGMLRSIGMEECQIRRMLFVECFSYGRTALLIGIPLGLLCGWGLLGISYNVEEVPYTLPLAELCVAVGTIFLVIFASMAYALSKLKKDDPIEAIRVENL